MRASPHFISFVKLSIAILVTSAQDDSSFEGKEFADFKVMELGVSKALHCNTSSNQWLNRPNDTDVYGWMLRLPDLRRITQSDESGKYEVLNNKHTLVIRNITVEDLGRYHCILISKESNYYLVTVGLNMGGPYFKNGWEEYKMNTIIGLASFAGFLLLTALVFLVYFNRWQPEKEKDSLKSEANGFATNAEADIVEQGAHKNLGMNEDCTDTTHSTVRYRSNVDTKDDIPNSEIKL